MHPWGLLMSDTAVDPLAFLQSLERRVQIALTALLRAHSFALDVHADPWQHAIEVASLHSLGCENIELRWLIARGLVRHGYEVHEQSSAARVISPSTGLKITDSSCFTVEPTQLEHIHRLLGPCNDAVRLGVTLPGTRARPHWDSSLQQLWLGERLVKHFRRPAPSQVLILDVFEEEGWPPRIDDPLPPQAGQLGKRRLHDAITGLNRNHLDRAIRFSCDGKALGILWHAIAQK